MELIEGASLQEHFTSLKEKKEKGMNEDRIWKIFIQVLVYRAFFCKSHFGPFSDVLGPSLFTYR